MRTHTIHILTYIYTYMYICIYTLYTHAPTHRDTPTHPHTHTHNTCIATHTVLDGFEPLARQVWRGSVGQVPPRRQAHPCICMRARTHAHTLACVWGGGREGAYTHIHKYIYVYMYIYVAYVYIHM